MQVSNHALFLAVSKTAGIRSLGVAHINLKLRDALPGHELRTRYDPDTNLATVSVRLSDWWWLSLGLAHLWVWWRARRAVLESMAAVQADIRVRVRWPKNRV